MNIEHTHKALFVSRIAYEHHTTYFPSTLILRQFFVNMRQEREKTGEGNIIRKGAGRCMVVCTAYPRDKGTDAGGYSAIWRVVNNFYCWCWEKAVWKLGRAFIVRRPWEKAPFPFKVNTSVTMNYNAPMNNCVQNQSKRGKQNAANSTNNAQYTYGDKVLVS